MICLGLEVVVRPATWTHLKYMFATGWFRDTGTLFEVDTTISDGHC